LDEVSSGYDETDQQRMLEGGGSSSMVGGRI